MSAKITDADFELVRMSDVKPREKQVFMADGYVSIPCLGDYDIELSRIKDARDIVKWVRHLSEKRSVTKEVLRDFIDVSCKHLGISPYGL